MISEKTICKHTSIKPTPFDCNDACTETWFGSCCKYNTINNIIILTDCGVNLEDVATSLSSARTLTQTMIDEAVDTMHLERQAMRGVPLTLLADKSDGHGKRGSTSFVKLAAQMDEARDHVKVTCIEI